MQTRTTSRTAAPVGPHGLSPAETATLLVDAGTQTGLVLDTLDARCDHDTDTALTIADGAGIDQASIQAWLNPDPIPARAVASIGTGVGAGDAAALLAVLPPPGPSVELDSIRLLDTFAGIEPNRLEPVHR